MLQFYRKVLSDCGHSVVVEATTGKELVEQCRASRADLVITDIKMPDMDGLQAAIEIRDQRPTPFILVSAYHDEEFVERAFDSHVLAYLVKPIKRADLEPAISLVMRRFREFEALREEARNLRQALEDRKLIERAKGVLMMRIGIDEMDAFKRLQKLASNHNLKLVEIARNILLAEEAYAET